MFTFNFNIGPQASGQVKQEKAKGGDCSCGGKDLQGILVHCQQATANTCLNEALTSMVREFFNCGFNTTCLAQRIPQIVLDFLKCQFGTQITSQSLLDDLGPCISQSADEIAGIVAEFTSCLLSGQGQGSCFVILLKLLNVLPKIVNCLLGPEVVRTQAFQDCLIKFGVCFFSGGDPVTCIVQFIQCLLGGSVSPTPPGPNPNPPPSGEGRVTGPVGRC